MKKYLMILLSGILAGICITFGATVYLMCLSYEWDPFIAKFVGAFMFCIGLFTIIHFNLWLYTGKIGYAIDKKPSYLIDCFVSFIGNIIGAVGLSALLKLSVDNARLEEQAISVVNAKLDSSWYSVFIMSMMCGMMIYLAVEGHKRCPYSLGKVLFVFLPIMLFIICGFEHVIANACYFTFAATFSPKAFGYFVLMFVGDALGSMLFALLLKAIDKLNTKEEAQNDEK